jgi:AcrR family transcriptional regulator
MQPSVGERSAQRPAGLRERKKERTRAQIQHEALQLFASRGYEQTTVEQIAEAAEVSVSTLFRYFTGKADIVRYDALDPLLFEEYTRQPAGLSPIVALRGATQAMLSGLPRGTMREQLERGRIVMAVPELRAAVLDDMATTLGGQFRAAEITRTGMEPDPFAVDVLVGALGGAITAAMRSAHGDDMELILDRTLALLERGLPV